MKLLRMQKKFIDSKPFELNIVKGKSNTGKSEAILHRILKLVNNFAFQEEDNILVVHKNAKQKESFAKRYKEVKEKHNYSYMSLLPSNNEPYFISLSELVNKYSNEKKTATLKQKEEAFKIALSNNAEEYKYCKKLDYNNLHLVLGEIKFMKNHRVELLEDYMTLMGAPLRQRKNSRARKSMFTFFNSYNEALKNLGVQDEEDKILEAIKNVEISNKKTYVHICADNVESLSKLELDFILKLANKKSYGTVTLSIDVDKAENIYSSLVKKGRVYGKKVFGANKKIFNFKTDVLNRNIENMPKVKEEKTYDRYNFIDLKHRREFDFSLEDNGHEVSLVGEEKYNKNELEDVPVFNNIAAGAPILINPTQEETFALPKYWVKGSNKKFILKIKGDSMIKVNIDDGDYVVIEQNPSPVNGDIVAVNIDGNATLKRIRIEKDKVVLLPENDLYAPIIVSKDQEFFVLGKAIGVIKKK